MFALSDQWIRNAPANPKALAQLWKRWGDSISADYIDFLQTTDGAILSNAQFWKIEEVLSDPYNATEFGPHLIVIGTDFCGELFAFDTRVRPAATAMVHSISNWHEDVAIVARSFRHLIERIEQLTDHPGMTLLDPF